MHALHTADEFNTLIQEKATFVIFKHSPTCGISGGACKVVNKAVFDAELHKLYMVDVLDHKPLSQHIATHTGIQHESPQIIFFKQGQAISHASHFAITPAYIHTQSLLL